MIEEAVVTQVAANHLILRLTAPDDDNSSLVYGYVPGRQTRDSAGEVGDLREKFKEGGKVKTKVVGLDYCGGVAVCTLQKAKMAATSTLGQLVIGKQKNRNAP